MGDFLWFLLWHRDSFQQSWPNCENVLSNHELNWLILVLSFYRSNCWVRCSQKILSLSISYFILTLIFGSCLLLWSEFTIYVVLNFDCVKPSRKIGHILFISIRLSLLFLSFLNWLKTVKLAIVESFSAAIYPRLDHIFLICFV